MARGADAEIERFEEQPLRRGIAVQREPPQVEHRMVEIPAIDRIGVLVGADIWEIAAQRLELALVLLGTSLVRLLRLLVLELAVVHDLAHGRACTIGDLHEVQTGLLRHAQGLIGRDDTEVLAFGVDEHHLADGDAFVDAGATVLGRGRVEARAKDGGPDFHQLEPIDELDAQNRGLQIGRMSKVC